MAEQLRKAGRAQYETQKAGRPLDRVTEIALCSCTLPNELVNELPQLTSLVRLTLLSMVPKLDDAAISRVFDALPANSKLRSLDLSDNSVRRLPATIAHSTALSSLQRLVLANNPVANAASLHLSAARFPALRSLDLVDSGAKDAAAIWTQLPNLAVLSGRDRSGREVFDASDDDDDDSEGMNEGDAVEGLGDLPFGDAFRRSPALLCPGGAGHADEAGGDDAFSFGDGAGTEDDASDDDAAPRAPPPPRVLPKQAGQRRPRDE